ncbi:hypothetical protein Taro_015633 [Colocasia esculenta]|uniref:Uncharacterized protein n=1 Tax=Colocasia esculenta TaxID=4460 RepID=A0A843UQG8_COLES|nr:hypothetical protein [Colocasia esculenta]
MGFLLKCVHSKLGCNAYHGYLSSRLPRHWVLRFYPDTVSTVKVCVVFLDTLTPKFEKYIRLRERWQWAATRHARGWGTDTNRRTGPQLVLFPVPQFRELGPESLKVSNLGLQLCGLQEWCWLVSTILDPVEVEQQLDLSSVAARLIGRLALFVQVKESRRVPVPLLVPVSTVVESGR